MLSKPEASRHQPQVLRLVPRGNKLRIGAAPAGPVVDGASALPPDVVRALRLVARDLRDMPRSCATDREELIYWLARVARRLDAVVASKARAAPPAATTSRPTAKNAPVRPATALPCGPTRPARAETAKKLPVRVLPARTRPATRWRAHQVTPALRRRVEAAGQLVLAV